MSRPVSDPLVRFIAKIAKPVDESQCWMWTGTLDGHGYGVFWLPGGDGDRRDKAHRLSYLLFRGPIPDELHLDHVCHNADPTCTGGKTCLHRRCVNPDHLEPVTPVENTRRGKAGQYLASKTHCVHGHEFTPENTYRSASSTGRACLACIRIRSKRPRGRAQ